MSRPPASIEASQATTAWAAAFRPTLLFVAAYAFNITPHEAVHAITSYFLGFNSTLFQMWVDPDPAEATPVELATIAGIGPLFSLLMGLIFFTLYRRWSQKSFGLLLLMMCMVGIYSFLGPLAGSALGGDFNLAFNFVDVPGWIRYLLSAIGFVLLPMFMYFMGKELVRWAPADFSRAKSVFCTTVAPWLIGTPFLVLIYWPLPAFLIRSTLLGSLFWIFAVVGAAMGFQTRKVREITRTSPAIPWADLGFFIAALAMVRSLAHGMRLNH
jgi:hypothetical protein